MIEISINVLIRGIILLSVFLLFVCIYLSIRRGIEVAHLQKKNSYIKNNQTLWYRYFRDEISFTRKLIPKDKFEIQGLEEIFLVYIKHLSNESIQNKIKQFSNQHLKQYYQKKLKSRKWSSRMNAMYRIIDFYIDSLVNDCKALKARNLSAEEQFLLLKIYSSFDSKTFLKEFLSLTVAFSEFEYKKLLAGVSSEILEELLDCFDKLPLNVQCSIIDILGIKRNSEYLSFLESMLQHENTEIRIRSLKAIYAIGIISDLNQYMPFIDSSIWEERLMMAKLLGVLPLSEAGLHLEKLLTDQSWWVRSQAATTIGKYKDGEKLLKQVILETKDSFAADMANEVLKKRVY
ncbi:HEAT repeat domain-containing protein [Heyndrickxia camelliae]|uniref:HEAT repeat domain-containing protein n=1 Tax=Heyndrickxia camelliae TaxID=1707093 RepID=A0A2N3LFL7_9BACI|nr:HEAT repeat domain-containing protein [Heyndrickxia camelliae]PKR83420.1 hypothetical protein CWO92_18830 [Heyndrickxia camelliae]